jgi:alpha-galactosidase
MKTSFNLMPLSILAGACLLLSAGGALAQDAQPARQTVWLDTLPLAGVSTGWGTAQANKSIQGQPLSIGGRKFQHGVGTHAVSRCLVDLQGGSETFSAWVGIDDEMAKRRSSVEFEVKGDRKSLWTSGVMRAGDAPKEVRLNIRGIRRLELLVSDAGDGTDSDHADWADAKFEVSGKAPRMPVAARTPPYILTPQPPATPRINGARVFGVRPGSPFLFTIPATGDRPMTFSVDNLPAGLRVDPQSGQITGALQEKGEYRVTFVAANARGTARRPFKIICGGTLALTPHMGWNSWYVWESHVTDQIMRAAADAMVTNGMINHGYMYVNIDDCWSVKPDSTDQSMLGAPRDARGMINSNKRFPDMKAMTDYIHARGLKAGIYTSPGPLTCAGHIGAYQHEELDAQRYAEWGFDFLKHDWCSYGGVAKNNSLPELKKPYELMSRLLRQQKRDIVLNLCQYGMGSVWEWGKSVGGHSWRTAGDLGGSFEGIASAVYRDGFGLNGREKWAGPGGWNDPDYLLIGYLSNWQGQTVPTPLTTDEQYTQVSLWCLLAAPLILSGDINRLDEFTLSLLSNDEVIEVDQDPLGQQAHRVALNEESETEVWAKNMEDGSKAVGLFNVDAFDSHPITVHWSDLGITGAWKVRDLWRQQDRGQSASQFQAQVPAHGVVMLRLAPVRNP